MKDIKTKEFDAAKRARWLRFIFRNIIAVELFFAVVFVLFKVDPSYRWVWEKLIGENKIYMQGLSQLTWRERNAVKQGFVYRFLDLINENTPETAIIRMPPDSVYDDLDEALNFDKLKTKSYVTYFVYPRRVVYEREKTTSELYDQANYIAIFDYHGYEQLNYEIADKEQFIILPLGLNQP